MSVQKVGRIVLVTGLLSVPQATWAQGAASGSIAGVVRDTTGGVMPGVTVEAASPALIEKVRTVVTDGEGRYNIVELRPGAYTVTFTLEGFNTFKREGIELTTGFTAAVNAEMRVGALSETVTVTGASPVVDVQNVRAQTVLSREVIDVLPTGRTVQGYAALTVGATVSGAGGAMHDVGGNKGEQYGVLVMHGTRSGDGRLNFDGMRYNAIVSTGGGSNRFWVPNQAAVQEVALETSGMSAESETGGAQQNSVPKDGGNTFNVYFSTTGTNGDLQSSNLTDRLRARGLTTVSTTKRIYDIGGGLGGPIKQDKLWFYTAHRWWGSQEYVPEAFFNQTQGTPFYTPDRSRRGFTNYYQKDHSLRLTWQAAAKHKFTFSDSVQRNCQCSIYIASAATSAPEAATDVFFTPVWMAQSTWTYPATNKLLFQAGGAYVHNRLNTRPVSGVSDTDITTFELSKGFVYNAATGGLGVAGYSKYEADDLSQHNERFSMSYVTGSHAFKVGLFTMWGLQNFNFKEVNEALYYNFNFGRPLSLVQWASPNHSESRFINVGTYAQDQWTIKKLTLNLGVRFDHIKAWVPAQERPAGRFAPAFTIARIENVPNFNDVNPRLGAAYDLFGNGRTALKATLGRYVGVLGPNLATLVNPANSVVQSSTRTWGDANGNYIPDCDLQSFEANGECGALDNKRFGTISPNTRYAEDVLEGFGRREYNWQTSVFVQHELRPRVAVNVGFFRTWFGNFRATDNVLVTPEDFDPFCITVAKDARLPDGGGQQICDGLADVKPAKFGLVDNVVTQASHFGNPQEIYTGVDATLNARFGQGGLLQGGVSVGRTVTECVVVDRPVQFCKNVPPFFLPQIKFSGIYPLPLWGLQTSVTFQSLPGIPIGATQVVTSAAIKPSLGRDLAAGPRGNIIATVLEPNKHFEDRLNQLDLRFTKVVRVGRARVQANFDIYNIFNGDTILSQRTRIGPTFLLPLQVMGARLLKFGAQLDF